MDNKLSQSTLNLFPTQTLVSNTHTHTTNCSVQHSCESPPPPAAEPHSSRTKLLRGRGLVAQVFPIEMQTLWYGNWQLQKPARIHTSMHWNHLRNVRWDGTSSKTRQTNGLNQQVWGGWEMGVEVQGGRVEAEPPGHLFPSLSFFQVLLFTNLFQEMQDFQSATYIFPNKTSQYSLPDWGDLTSTSLGIAHVNIK